MARFLTITMSHKSMSHKLSKNPALVTISVYSAETSTCTVVAAAPCAATTASGSCFPLPFPLPLLLALPLALPFTWVFGTPPDTRTSSSRIAFIVIDWSMETVARSLTFAPSKRSHVKDTIAMRLRASPVILIPSTKHPTN